jgi:anaerobic magnesium-protoporphyrin IX monomethyl ester cyclase
MKICLLELPLPFSKPEYISYPGTPFLFPNMGMGYVASVLEEKGYEVDTLECPGMGISLQNLYKIVEREQYDIIGLSTYYFDYGVALVSISRILNIIKRRVPNAYIVAGGYLASLNYDLVLDSIEKIDCCVIGEGEYTFPELIKTLEEKGDLSQVKGIAFKNGEEIIKTQARSYIKDLDTLPYPRRAFISEDIKAIGVLSSRGCYGKCTFCVDKELWKTNGCNLHRRRSVEKVVEEIEYVKNNYDFLSIYMFDTNFMGSSKSNQEWLKKFCDLMQEKNLSIPFRIEARANDVIANKGLMGRLKEVGLWRIFMGIESFIQRQLDFFEKCTTVNQNIQALEICHDLGIKPEYGFLMLEPMVTLDEILENVRIIKSIKLYEFSYPCQELLSTSSRRLVAPPGVRANSFVKEHSLTAENYFCYDFVNDDVELYFAITKIWEKQLKLYYPYYYLFNSVLDEKSETSRILAEGNVKVKKLDVEFVEELAVKIKNKEIEKPEDAEMMLDSWDKQMKEVFASYIPIKKRIDGQRNVQDSLEERLAENDY